MKPALLYILLFICTQADAQKGRQEIDLSLNNWTIWLDTAAGWQNDHLLPPPVTIQALPVNLPTGGWAALRNKDSKKVKVPATVEEFYRGNNSNPFGLSGNYTGVSWFSTLFKTPANSKGKRLCLHFESVRYRAAIFVNHKLVGYDLTNSTPFDIGISEAVNIQGDNDLDVRTHSSLNKAG